MKTRQTGFAVLEALLIIILFSIISGTGYYVWHSKSNAYTTYNNLSSKSISSKSLANNLKTFDECAKAPGSTIQTSYPQVCTASDGQKFTQKVSLPTVSIPAEVDGHTTCAGGVEKGYCITGDSKKIPLQKVQVTARSVGWNQAPVDLQKAIQALWPTDCNGLGPLMPPSEALRDTNSIIINSDNNFATAGVGGCEVGGADHLFVKVGGTFKDVGYTQVGWDCKFYDQYAIPKGFVADSDGYAICQTQYAPAIY